MPYSPEFPDEIRRRLVSRLIATSRLVDLSEGSDYGMLLGGVADEMSSLQQKLGEFRDSHFFNAAGQLLEDRCAQMPGFDPRRDAARARGGAFTITRNATGTSLTIPEGSLKVGRSDAPDLVYTNEYPITMGIGVSASTLNSFVCATPGFVGNAPPGAVNRLSSAPASVVDIYNTQPLTGGRSREDDASLSARAQLYWSSLTRTTRPSLEALTLNFRMQGSDEVVRTLAVRESLLTPGYTEILIDNGQGFVGSKRAASPQFGRVPTIDSVNARYQFTFESPAATPPSLTIGSNTYTSPHPSLLVLEERGVIILRASHPGIAIAPGDTWQTGGHEVLVGFPAALQSYLAAQCRASGVRVRVVLPRTQEVFLSANVTVRAGASVARVFADIRAGVVAYLADLPPGQPLLMYRLGVDLSTIPGVRNIRFDQDDLYPSGEDVKFISYPSNITLR